MVDIIRQLAAEFQEQIPNCESISWYAWVKQVHNTSGGPYYQEFCTKLSELDELTLKSTYTKFRTCPQKIY